MARASEHGEFHLVLPCVQTVLTVFIIDDDSEVRDSIALMLGLLGFRAAVFADAEAFLWPIRPTGLAAWLPTCGFRGKAASNCRRNSRARGSTLPVVIITAHGDVPSARAAFQAQAVDFLEKPFDDAQLRAAIDHRVFAARGVASSGPMITRATPSA